MERSHCLHRATAAAAGSQVLPSLKEVEAWQTDKFMRSTSTVYFELIPEKPSSKETILRALFDVEKLFVRQKGYKNVIVSGDGLTVVQLYKIKDEYGSTMDWLLVMLGSWHTLKDFLRIFYQKYQHAFMNSVLRTHFTNNTVEGICRVSTWYRSHYFAELVMEALQRHFLEAAMSSEQMSQDTVLKLKKAAEVR